MSGHNGYVQFVNDDQCYLRWLAQNPGGYVVNSFRVPTSDYLILHRAACRWINTGVENNWTTTGYIKTCSENVQPLQAWANQATSGTLKPCRSCNPDVPHEDLNLFAGKESPSESDCVQVSDELPPMGTGTVPLTISTGCPQLDQAWATYASMILNSPILIPNTDEDLTWHAFLGHSIDMQGFRAAEFAGVDPLTREAPKFVSLKARGIGVPELAALWDIPAIRQHLLARNDDRPLDVTLDVLTSPT